MKFSPRTEEELTRANLIDPGQYKFRVGEAKDKVSKSGSEMIELKLFITDMQGKERFVFCYLLDAMPHLVKHFCDSVGLEMKYNDGTLLANDCAHKHGYVDIMVTKGKDKNGNEIDRNAVKDFITADKFNSAPAQPSDFEDSNSIPF